MCYTDGMLSTEKHSCFRNRLTKHTEMEKLYCRAPVIPTGPLQHNLGFWRIVAYKKATPVKFIIIPSEKDWKLFDVKNLPPLYYHAWNISWWTGMIRQDPCDPRLLPNKFSTSQPNGSLNLQNSKQLIKTMRKFQCVMQGTDIPVEKHCPLKYGHVYLRGVWLRPIRVTTCRTHYY